MSIIGVWYVVEEVDAMLDFELREEGYPVLVVGLSFCLPEIIAQTCTPFVYERVSRAKREEKLAGTPSKKLTIHSLKKP